MEFESTKKIYIFSEIEIAIRLIDNGLAGIQSLNNNGNFLFHPLLLLSQGFERFFKIYILLVDFERNGVEPDNSKLRNIGHKISKLKAEILDNLFVDDRLPFSNDLLFLQNDDLVKELFEIFDFFSDQSGRYFNLNAICGVEKESSPENNYSLMESQLIKNSDYLNEKLNDVGGYDEVKSSISEKIVICIEKSLRAFLRQFTLAKISPTGLQASSKYMHYVTLSDDKLGKTDYLDKI
jgi:hypothetical protein